MMSYYKTLLMRFMQIENYLIVGYDMQNYGINLQVSPVSYQRPS